MPSSLATDVSAVRQLLAQMATGKPASPSPAVAAALNAFDKWGHDACSFTKIDITTDGHKLSGVPQSVPAGVTSVSFANRVSGPRAGFILLFGKVRPGAHYTLKQISNSSISLPRVADIVVAAQPADGVASYSTVDLTPGTYIVALPLGHEPHFAAILVGQFTVT